MSERTDAPGPMLRRGPRPLLLHLMLASLKSSGFAPASPTSSTGLPSSSPSADSRETARTSSPGTTGETSRNRPEPVQPDGPAHIADAARELISGIAAYRRHPWRREFADPPASWREGGSRVLDYGGEGPKLLFIPSLINRSYVLDLAPGRSMLRFLAANGARVMLLDWGWPGEVERAFTLTDYIAGRLERALLAIGEPVIVVGYCMGGLLAVAAAERRPALVRALALLATPWDFHAAGPSQSEALARLAPALEMPMQLTGTLSIDLLQTLFALLDPSAVAEKYAAFGRLPQDSERARLFVALEDWLNDGVPLAAAVARECLDGWYGANSPARGQWKIADRLVAPAELALPCFVAVPARDRIVPPESARPLAAAIGGARLHEPAAGHVGMVAGRTAERALWRPLLEWLSGL